MAQQPKQFQTSKLSMSDVASRYTPQVQNTAYTPFAPLNTNVQDAIASFRAGQAAAESAATGQPVTTQPSTGLPNTGYVPYNVQTGQLGDAAVSAPAGPAQVDLKQVTPAGTPANVSTPNTQAFNAADNYQSMGNGAYGSAFNTMQQNRADRGFDISKAGNNPYVNMVNNLAQGKAPDAIDPREQYIKAHAGLSNAGAIYDILAQGKALENQFNHTGEQPKKLSEIVKENQAKLAGQDYAWAHQNPMAEGMGYQWNDDALTKAGWTPDDIADLKSITDMHPQMINDLRQRGFLSAPYAQAGQQQ